LPDGRAVSPGAAQNEPVRTTLDPRLVDPTAYEPGLVIDVRDERRALLVDLGPNLATLPPRVLLRATHAFVTHTHMDHWAGFDHLLALSLGRVRRLVLWGGPGFCAQVEHKLRAYTWNVVHRYEVPMVIEAHALEADGSRTHARFESVRAFARSGIDSAPPEPQACGDDVLLEDPLFRVRATIVDHEMPVLAFGLEEKAQVRVATDRIAAMGLATGAWLRTLKRAVLAGVPEDTPIDLAWRDRTGDHADRRTLGELRALVLDTIPGRRIGYVTDLRFTSDNVARLECLLKGADLLYLESVFGEAEREMAARKNHLTGRQAGEIARRLGAKRLVPFHFSPRYRTRHEQTPLREAMEAFSIRA
jgi:ribonuclease Z